MASNSIGNRVNTVCFGKRLRADEFYSRLSALLGVVLLAGLTNDIVQYTILENPLETTQSFTYITLVFHILAFIMSMLAFVYTTSRYKRNTDRISCTLITFNGLLFVLRIVLELALINYRREYYNS